MMEQQPPGKQLSYEQQQQSLFVVEFHHRRQQQRSKTQRQSSTRVGATTVVRVVGGGMLQVLVFLMMLILLTSTTMTTTNAMYIDDIDQLDLYMTTAGHGSIISSGMDHQSNNNDHPPGVVWMVDNPINKDDENDGILITTSGSAGSDDCYIAGRHVLTGWLQWRQNICVVVPRDTNKRHRVLYTTVMTTTTKSNNGNNAKPILVSLQVESRILRGWDMITGQLVWDRSIEINDHNANDDDLILKTMDNKEDSNFIFMAAVRKNNKKKPSMFRFWDARTGIEMVTSRSDGNNNEDSIIKRLGQAALQTLHKVEEDAKEDETSSMTVTSSTKSMHRQLISSSITKLSCLDHTIPLLRTTSTTATTTTTTNMIVDPTVLVFTSSTTTTTPKNNIIPGIQYGVDQMTILSCTASTILVLTLDHRGTTSVIELTTETDPDPDTGKLRRMYDAQLLWTQEEGLADLSAAILLDASHDEDAAVVVGTTTTTTTDRVDPLLSNPLQFTSRLQLQWQSISSMVSQVLSLFNVRTTVTPNSNNNKAVVSTTSHHHHHRRRDMVFGFVKIALLLSSSHHRLYGIDTMGPRKSQIRFQLDLPLQANWHRMIHGSSNRNHNNSPMTTTTSSKTTTSATTTPQHGGVHGGAHTREVLILSYVPPSADKKEEQQSQQRQVDWICIEGTTGQEHSRGSVVLPPTSSGDIVQIIPLTMTTTALRRPKCRQGALLVLADQTIVSVTGEDPFMSPSLLSTTSAAVDSDQSQASPQGDDSTNHVWMYTHVLESAHNHDNMSDSYLKSYGISSIAGDNPNDAQQQQLGAHLVGTATFPGEDIVAVAYPSRDEIVHSPCDILGDDSLLLKYINPHLAVLITMTSSSSTSDASSSVAPDFDLRPKSRNAVTQKRKPLGVSQPGGAGGVPIDGSRSMLDDPPPNLFVNIVDTVSGRILYRASHTNAAPIVGQSSSAKHHGTPRPTVLVSENWIFYSFTNIKTRKVELGVLSLYEGMIDKAGLTAFTSPEQLTSFSSLEARETKPVVLAKSYTIPMAVTALGMTATRSGISGRQLLLATMDGQIHSIDRKLLEPRRPLGPLKPAEKKEGLTQYHELVHKISYNVLSYHRNVEGVHGIISAPTDLESQSLILAYGGPDLFFTRMSPSKGFDLLPDTFNKFILSAVVLSLIVLLLVMQTVVSKKIKTEGWA